MSTRGNPGREEASVMRTAASLLCLLHLHSWSGPKVKLAGTGRPQRSKVDWHRDTKWTKLNWVYRRRLDCPAFATAAYSHVHQTHVHQTHAAVGNVSGDTFPYTSLINNSKWRPGGSTSCTYGRFGPAQTGLRGRFPLPNTVITLAPSEGIKSDRLFITALW